MEYQTPFVGLFVPPECYVTLLENFAALIKEEVVFAKESKYQIFEQIRNKSRHRYPIGVLGGRCELHFLHYRTEEEAADKWRRRAGRIVEASGALFFKFCDRDGCQIEHMKRFNALGYRNKVLFTSRRQIPAVRSVIIPSSESAVPDGLELSRISYRYFDVVDWLNGGSGTPRMPRIVPSI